MHKDTSPTTTIIPSSLKLSFEGGIFDEHIMPLDEAFLVLKGLEDLFQEVMRIFKVDKSVSLKLVITEDTFKKGSVELHPVIQFITSSEVANAFTIIGGGIGGLSAVWSLVIKSTQIFFETKKIEARSQDNISLNEWESCKEDLEKCKAQIGSLETEVEKLKEANIIKAPSAETIFSQVYDSPKANIAAQKVIAPLIKNENTSIVFIDDGKPVTTYTQKDKHVFDQHRVEVEEDIKKFEKVLVRPKKIDLYIGKQWKVISQEEPWEGKTISVDITDSDFLQFLAEKNDLKLGKETPMVVDILLDTKTNQKGKYSIYKVHTIRDVGLDEGKIIYTSES